MQKPVDQEGARKKNNSLYTKEKHKDNFKWEVLCVKFKHITSVTSL